MKQINNVYFYAQQSRYLTTSDYFNMCLDEFDLISDTKKPLDFLLVMNKGCQHRADVTLYYERDCKRELLFQAYKPYVYYTNFGKWQDSQVIMHAAKPNLHKKTHASIADVVFCGRLYPERKRFLNALIEQGINLKIFSDGFKTDDYVKNLSKGKIIIADSHFNEINRRTFEAMSIGCMVHNRVPGLFKVGQEGKHYLSYEKNNVDQAVSQIKKLLKDKDLRNKINKQSRQHVKQFHTYKHRLKQFLDIANNLYV
jgi:glycosyltransferase involved in cell wall biosynthesis